MIQIPIILAAIAYILSSLIAGNYSAWLIAAGLVVSVVAFLYFILIIDSIETQREQKNEKEKR